MANKRMFSSSVVETDKFLGLPLKSQALYFHLGMQGDDDGFVANSRTIIRSLGCTLHDLKVLENAGYVISFPSNVLVITDWRTNNTLKNDRYHRTLFQKEFFLLSESSSGRYILRNSGSILEPEHNITEQNIESAAALADAERWERKKASQPDEPEWEVL